MKTKKTVKKPGLFSIFTQGDIFSKLSFIIMGISNIVRKQIVKGLIYLAIEVGYFFYMIRSGFSNILEMRTLGTSGQGMVFDDAQGIYGISQGDNSMLILLYGVATIVLTAVFLVIWAFSIRAGEEARQLKLNNKKVPNFIDEVKALFDYNIHKLILAVPLLGIITFTVTPLIYMILIAFTNYDAEHQPPGNLFTWVGLANFKNLLSASGKLSSTFWPVLGWTFIWGFVATFSCYFGGMFLAMLINSKGIGGKKVWRTFFVTTMAIPSFITLLVVGTMLGKNGILNVLLLNWGFVSEPLPFLTNGLWAKITVIVVNIWIG
ncbi:MAG: sugar ABC transporter permease, partial [Lachnospiraceae bacterium]|nr:sugar ABC transporter permease [Lachnospiraceae bacterium]